ncbi:MAG TPA: hypothetical protein VGF34_13550 [Stellaceae bacterium]|jgi:hypothetical protein
MNTAKLSRFVQAPPGWNAQREIAARFPALAERYRAVLPQMRSLEARLDADEACGRDTSYLRQALAELRWRFEYTADLAGAERTFDRIVRTAARSGLPSVSAAGGEGGFGIGTEVWFLEIDASVDHWLAAAALADGTPPRLLDRVNDPDRLISYLDGLLVSRLDRDAVDHRKELNFATANLVRLILQRRPVGYPWHPRLEPAIRSFIADWQDPATGFFGAGYELDDRCFRTADLSMTFHMARYLDGDIGYWPQLVDTLIGMREARYPNGWLDEAGMTSHNNYDVAVLFRLGWDKISAEQRRRAQHELAHLTDWCLTNAIAADGTIALRAASESLPESYYFTIAFLDTVGFFDPAKRFWTDRPFAGAAEVKAQLETGLSHLDPAQPMARMARERLHAS